MARLPAVPLALLALAGAAPCWGAGVPEVELPGGVRMPMLAFGSARSSFKGECTVTEAVKQWLSLGGRHIDTANNYGTQPDVGRALEESGVPRADIFLTTKIPGPIGKQEAIAMITNASLPQLGVDYIDLVLVHTPCLEHKFFPNLCGAKEAAARLDTWQGLLELRAAGKIRAVGVSNFDAEQVAELARASGVAPAVNQVEWHLGYHNETLLAAMKADGVVLEAWAPLAGPTAGMAGHPGVPLGDPHLGRVAAGHHGATAAQVALRWSVHKGVAPVTATCSAAHAKGDLAAFDFDLSEDEVSLLDSLTPGGPDALVV